MCAVPKEESQRGRKTVPVEPGSIILFLSSQRVRTLSHPSRSKGKTVENTHLPYHTNVNLSLQRHPTSPEAIISTAKQTVCSSQPPATRGFLPSYSSWLAGCLPSFIPTLPTWALINPSAQRCVPTKILPRYVSCAGQNCPTLKCFANSD